jgi:thiamine biosynthesis lipoprotein
MFERSEARFSRFRQESELSRLNRSVGPTVVSAEMFHVLRSARRFHALTGGIFDPTVGAALSALGYDRSFAPGSLDRETTAEPAALHSFAEVVLDETARTVVRPRDVALDLGGIVKGRTVDEAAALLPSNAAIDAGGDALALGGGPSGRGWRVDVEDPRDARRTLVTLVLRDRAVATSGVNRRRWNVAGETAHHVIDPRTGESARTDLAQVTVVAARVEDAEVLAKAALVLGADRGTAFIARFPDAAAAFVHADGNVTRVGDLEVERA